MVPSNFMMLIMGTLATLLEPLEKVAGLPMQVLMVICIITLGGAIIWQNKYSNTQNASRHAENQIIQDRLLKKLETQQETFTTERTNRISSLMDMLRDETKAKLEDVSAKRDISNALQNNTSAINELRRLIESKIP